MAGPVDVRSLAGRLHARGLENGSVPRGLGGTPVVNLVLSLLDRGHHVVLFTLDRDVNDEVVVEGPNLRVCIGPYRAKGRGRDRFAVERQYLSTAFEREAPDLIHAHWTYEFAAPAVESGIPHVVTAHDAPLRVLQFDMSPYRVVRTIMAAQVARHMRALVAVSPYIAHHFRHWFGYRSEIAVIPNSVPSELIAMGLKRLSSSQEPQAFTFGSVLNGWNPLKNGATLLRAFQMVRRSIPQARLLMFGTDYGPSELAEAWANGHGLTTGVTFVGQTPPVQLWEALSTGVDVLVHPSREESFSMAIAEAMALGLPVIGGHKSGAVPWTLEQGTAGRLVDVASAPMLARAMTELALDASLRRQLGVAANRSASFRFGLPVVAQSYESIYERVLAGHAEGHSGQKA